MLRLTDSDFVCWTWVRIPVKEEEKFYLSKLTDHHFVTYNSFIINLNDSSSPYAQKLKTALTKSTWDCEKIHPDEFRKCGRNETGRWFSNLNFPRRSKVSYDNSWVNCHIGVGLGLFIQDLSSNPSEGGKNCRVHSQLNTADADLTDMETTLSLTEI